MTIDIKNKREFVQNVINLKEYNYGLDKTICGNLQYSLVYTDADYKSDDYKVYQYSYKPDREVFTDSLIDAYYIVRPYTRACDSEDCSYQFFPDNEGMQFNKEQFELLQSLIKTGQEQYKELEETYYRIKKEEE
jgi:NDP-sugar pyrophosphorylase family protein